MPAGLHTFTSESVSMGHPDKVADQVSDAVLDALLEQDPSSRVACETFVKSNVVVVGGEITIPKLQDKRTGRTRPLEEAINLSGLFIESGPVVLAKDPSGNITNNIDKNPSIAYTGPMVVVMNRLSASASEIFAAAMQDYGRAVVVGDERSFGKGTVQTVQDLDRSMSLPFFNSNRPPAGTIKLTIQKFYRVSGGSTQLNGVESDIVLPSRTDSPKIGEGAFKNPLGYDEVAPVPFKLSPNAGELFVAELRERSARRIAADPEFLYVSEDMQRFRERLEKNTISTIHNKDPIKKSSGLIFL